MSSEMFAIAQDQDCHWFLFPANKRVEFEAWNRAWEDENGDMPEAPGWAILIDGPHVLSFSNPEVD